MKIPERVDLVGGISEQIGNSVFHQLLMKMPFLLISYLHRFWYMLMINQLVVIVDVISDEDAFPVHKFSTSLMVNVVDLSAFPDIAEVISDEDDSLVNN